MSLKQQQTKNVLFLTPSVGVVSEAWLDGFIEMLKEDISVIAVRENIENAWSHQFPFVELAQPSLGSKITHLIGFGERKSTSLRSSSRVLLQTIEDYSIDCVFAHYLNFAIRFKKVWQQSPVPWFVHAHGYDITWDLKNAKGQSCHPKNYLDDVKQLANHTQIIANSEVSKQQFLKIGIPAERIVVKYIGSKVPDQPLTRDDSAELKILYLGRLVDFKAPDLVIRAFERACEQGLKARLLMAGDGEMFEECKALQAQSSYGNKIEMLGAVSWEQGEELRRTADIFTAHNCLGPCSQQHEAFGVSVVEAMSAALPVITGKSGGVTETIHDQVTGILVPPGDIEAHANAFLHLARNPELRLQMGLEGWKRAKQLFSRETEKIVLRNLLGCTSENTTPTKKIA